MNKLPKIELEEFNFNDPAEVRDRIILLASYINEIIELLNKETSNE